MKSTISTAAIVVMAAGTTASAEIAYNNFGPGDTYNAGANHPFEHNDFFSYRHGQQFLSGATGDADTLKLVVYNGYGTASATLRLYNDSGSNTIGSQIGGDFTFTTSAASSVVTILDVSGTGWELVSGQKYWLYARSANDAGQHWVYNSTGDSGLVDVEFGSSHGYGTNTLGVFSIEVVPAPASAALLGLGGLLAARRRR